MCVASISLSLIYPLRKSLIEGLAASSSFSLPLALKLLDFAECFVASNIGRKFIIGETGMYHKEIPEIPAEAIREAVANALCHRDYATGTAVEVNVFMDTVQIVSSGLFPEGDSPERHLEGVASEFGLRNPAIARTLFRAGVIEQYGTGIPRIKEACEAAGVRFRFEQTVNSTVVVFKRPGLQVNDRLAARRPAQLAPLPIQRCSKTSTRPRGSPRDEEGAHGAGERRKNQGDEDAETARGERGPRVGRERNERSLPILSPQRKRSRLAADREVTAATREGQSRRVLRPRFMQ